MNLRKLQLHVVLCLVLGFAAGCERPAEKQVVRDFRQAHASYSVISANVGEGDADTMYYLIRYTKPNVAGVFRAEWMYQKVDGNWAVRHKQESDVPCGQTESDCK
jgi:hypothetical protein